ncbi:ran GTPase activating protein 1 [Cucurbitaria berberidis CBS 394.84]|uniref:Ran GTPase activating protein 1 n=1 Tax=Cucurbitaria berberidis CBS 394.84 TaxID=1168544 RepID=A0A9P4G6N5_9PLEO|nr:ran GTPase activating protein 1 [Cucurbitaria berberidis CBS 394.84]KAF1839906.1 ran GTPase activating protein 1 [Cucurbitaria berberidis CBS 394.84]
MSASNVFSLEGRGLKLTTADDIAPHIEALKSNDHVDEVRLLGNTLGIGASEALAKVLEGKKGLKVANLADIFTSRLLSEIPPALSHLLTSLLTLPNLHTVDLSDNAFGLNTVAPLVDFLSQHTPLRYLYLNNNGLGPAAGVLVADALTALAAKKESARSQGKPVPDLELVICGRNRLENGSMVAWAKAYAANTGVKTIKMTQNGIRQEGISHLIANGLSHLVKLETLDLQDNTFTTLGASALSKVVGNWTDLVELGVGDCLLGGRGGNALAAALDEGKNKKIQILRLQFNEINAKGLARLASASATALPALRRVELNGNKFDEEDPSIGKLHNVLEARKEESGEHEDDEEYWGLDELDELESEDEEEEDGDGDEEEEGIEVEERAARQLVEDQRAEESNVSQEKDKKVDALADLMAKTEIK